MSAITGARLVLNPFTTSGIKVLRRYEPSDKKPSLISLAPLMK